MATPKRRSRRLRAAWLTMALTAIAGSSALAITSGDAYIKRDGLRWMIGSGSIERTITLSSGNFATTSIMDKRSNRELLPSGAGADELAFGLGSAENRITGLSGGWTLVDSRQRKLSQGELQLDITVARESIQVTKSYLVHPSSSVIREWMQIGNTGSQPVKIIEPSFMRIAAKTGDLSKMRFNWMTGADNFPGTWKLKTESLTAGKPRVFDSFDAFQGEKFTPMGDGVNARVDLNGKQVWPATGWAYSADERVTIPLDVTVDVKEGDRLSFLVNMNGNFGFDTTRFDPAIAYADGETHVASQEFSDTQGKSAWRYQYVENGAPVDLVYYPTAKQWRKAIDNATGTPFISADKQHPDAGQDAARVWTAPKSGKVRITASVCNTGNSAGANSSYGWRLGSTSYAPWFAMQSGDTGQGMIFGWDYFGHWTSTFTPEANGAVTAQFKVAGHKQTLQPGQKLTTPKAFIALFQGDLDNAGNELLDWQYHYMWDYARKDWFPAVRMLGYWMKGTCWTSVGWVGGVYDFGSTYRKIFRTADFMSNTGGDVYHRDWGWWDRAGDWNGPDFRSSGEYLRKHDMGQLIYAFMYTVDPKSKVAQEHPEWLADKSVTLDMSIPEVVDFIGGQLDGFYDKWGRFEWRNDSNPMWSRDGDDTSLLAQDQGFRKIMQGFLDRHPDCAFQPVNGGGNCAGYDYVRYGSSLQFSDGAVGILGNYYASMLFPPDKINNMPDIWDPAHFDKATWRGLLAGNFDMTGDTWNPPNVEGIREIIDIYHYLLAQGVVGRWVHVYRPTVVGDNPEMFIQRMSRDARRGIIITKHLVDGSVTITPKGLLPGAQYTVSYQDGSGTEGIRTGADLMKNGIHLDKVAPGELIYLNLPLHPGSKLDTTAPSAPAAAEAKPGVNMGYPGVEVRWSAAKDDNWVSYYEIMRDGMLIDTVAKGTFYFDHSAGADAAARYSVRAVDGAGNRSPATVASAPTATRSLILDDAAPEISYTGEWKRSRGLQPAYNGTINGSREPGASATFKVEGRRLLWFAKLGADCGEATVSIDGGTPEKVDTYSADDIWGACVFAKDLTPGAHVVTIKVAGSHTEFSMGDLVNIDGIRIER